MDELHAILGVLLVTAVAFAGYLAVSEGLAGAVAQPYKACCCNMLVGDQYTGRTLVRSQIQTYADDCTKACSRYQDDGNVFPQEGLCAENP